TQKEQLNRLMGREPDTPFDVDPAGATDFALPDLKQAYAQAIESRPETRLARLQAKRAELDRRLKAAERIPDVSLAMTTVAAVNLNDVLPNRFGVVGLQFQLGRLRLGTKKETSGRETPCRTAGHTGCEGHGGANHHRGGASIPQAHRSSQGGA